MSEFNVASRYANALIELAEDTNNLDRVSNDVELICNTLSKSKELRALLYSPIVREEKKIDILIAVFKNYVGKDSLNFLKFVDFRVIINLNNISITFYEVRRRYFHQLDHPHGKRKE